jgi:ankyrin repeat protein
MPPTIDTLAPEPLFAIAEHLPLDALYALLRCNRFLYRRLLHTLYRRAVTSVPMFWGERCPWMGNARQVARSLAAGLDVNAIVDGFEIATRLHIAARNLAIGPTSAHWTRRSNSEEELKVMGLLLAHGADVNAKTSYGQTPLHIVLERDWGNNWTGRLEDGSPLMLLLRHGADVNTVAGNGDSPLHWAMKFQSPRTVAFLLAHGADVHKRDCRGNSPLMNAVTAGSPEMVASLLEHGADPHETDHTWKSLLHYAAVSHSPTTVALLLIYGADVHQTDYLGRSPLIDAVSAGSREIVSLLLKYGADPHKPDHTGRSPLFYAAIVSSEMLGIFF